MADVKITLPLKDIQDAIISRLKMLEELKEMTTSAIGRGGEWKVHNEEELARMIQKTASLQEALERLNGACCPNQMDCEHLIKG